MARHRGADKKPRNKKRLELKRIADEERRYKLRLENKRQQEGREFDRLKSLLGIKE